MQKNNTRLLFDTMQKLTQNGLKDLNIRPEIIKYIEEHIGTKVVNLGLTEAFIKTPKARE